MRYRPPRNKWGADFAEDYERNLEDIERDITGVEEIVEGSKTNAEKALTFATEAKGKAESVQAQFNQVVIEGDSSVEAAQARVDAKNVAQPTLKARLDKDYNEVTAQLAETVKVVNVEAYGVRGDGVTDYTLIIKDLLKNNPNSVVYFPGGEYLITEPLQIGQKTKLVGESRDATIFKVVSNIDLFHLGYRTEVEDITVRVDTPDWNSNIFSINEKTLSGTTKEINSNLEITVRRVFVLSHHQGGENSTLFALSMEGIYGSGNDVGFYGVRIYEVVYKGQYLGYFFRSWTKQGYWITGVEMNDCGTIATRWFIFDGKYDNDLNDTSISNSVDVLLVKNCQAQCSSGKSKGFAYHRFGRKSFVNSVPWDWHFAIAPFSSYPYVIHHKAPTKVLNIQGTTPAENNLCIVDEIGSVKPVGWNFTLINRFLQGHQIPPSLVPRRFGLVENSQQSLKAVKIFEGSTPTDSPLVLSFKYLSINGTYTNTMGADVVLQFDTQTKTLSKSYINNFTALERMNFGWKYDELKDVFKVYAVAVNSFTLMDVIETIPVSNNLTTFSSISGFANSYRTVNIESIETERYDILPTDIKVLKNEFLATSTDTNIPYKVQPTGTTYTFRNKFVIDENKNLSFLNNSGFYRRVPFVQYFKNLEFTGTTLTQTLSSSAGDRPYDVSDSIILITPKNALGANVFVSEQISSKFTLSGQTGAIVDVAVLG